MTAAGQSRVLTSGGAIARVMAWCLQCRCPAGRPADEETGGSARRASWLAQLRGSPNGGDDCVKIMETMARGLDEGGNATRPARLDAAKTACIGNSDLLRCMVASAAIHLTLSHLQTNLQMSQMQTHSACILAGIPRFI
jgi:hypothetical protein